MDGMTGSNNEAFPHSNLFADNQQYNAYDPMNLFPNGSNTQFHDSNWAASTNDFSNQSRAQHQSQGWQQNANHLPALQSHPGYNGHATSYGRSLSHSPAPFAQNAFANYGPPHQTYQYRPPQYDPSLVATPTAGQKLDVGSAGYHGQGTSSATIAPQFLEHETRPPTHGGNNLHSGTGGTVSDTSGINQLNQRMTQLKRVDQRALVASIPTGTTAGLFQIINFDGLAQATNSERMGNFVNIGKDAQDWDCNRSAIPSFVPRKSRAELKALVGNNTALLSKISKKSHRSSTINTAPTKPLRPLQSSQGQPDIKYEQEVSSDDDSSDSDDDSAYSDEDVSDSPLPAKRPDSPKGAIEYDTIKALWRSKRRGVDAETIRKSLVDFWEIVKTIRDRWKADSQAVTDAEEKKRVGELPLLKSRVKDQRDMIETAFRTAYKHGHRTIVELFAENVSLVFLCYQFLLDRFKDDDCNGSLPRAILETMSTFTTLTEEKMEKTHLIKVIPRYQKKSDAKSQYWLKKIIANVEAATREAAAKAPAGSKTSTEPKKPALPSDAKPRSPPTKSANPQPVAGVKRAAGSVGESTAKKAATDVAKSKIAAASAKTDGAVKKPLATGSDVKSTNGTTTPTVTRKTVVAKPSGFFSSLQSAQKRPGASNADKAAASKPTIGRSTASSAPAPPKPAFSFAETMANLSKPKEEKPAPKPEKEKPTETDEQRVKRLRNEERRKLNVKFKRPEELVEIRYFTHDPEEETHNDASQVRDVSDVGGEGRMFKQQHQMMDIDDEDEIAEETESLIDFKPPSLVDFSTVPDDERDRSYIPLGGGRLKPDSPERATREQYESSTLIVVYTDFSQVPPNPREPANPYNGEAGGSVSTFGIPTDGKFSARARTKRATQLQAPRPGSTGHDWNLSGYTPPAPQPTHSMPPLVPDLQQILANLRQSTSGPAASFPQPPPAAPAFAPPPFTAGLTSNGLATQAPPPVPSGTIDISSILAALQKSQPQNGQPPAGQYNAPVPAPMNLPPQTQQTATFGITGGSDGANNNDADLSAKHPFYKTKLCRFWSSGRCQKGEACSYVHES